MQVKLLKDIVSEIAGEPAEKIVDLLYDKKNVNEFLIAKKLDLTINQTRNILYRLGDAGLVSFIRKKDSKKGGWYTYFWTLNTGKSIELLKNRVASKLEKIDSEHKKRKNQRFYYCPDANIEYTEEEALEHEFVCPETGGVLNLKDNSGLLLEMEKDIKVLKEILEHAERELEIIQVKEQKIKDRQLRKEVKAKAEEREKRRKKLARERKKLKGKGSRPASKKSKKKPVKKKTRKKKPAKRKVKKRSSGKKK